MKQCKKCGYKIEDSIWFDNRIVGCVILITIVLFVAFGIKANSPKETASTNQTIHQDLQQAEQENNQNNVSQINKKQSYAETLKQLEKYQAQYWEIIKRNDLLIDQGMEENVETDKDQKELMSLFKTVENKIDKDNQFYKKLEIIEKQFANNNGETQYDMNNFAGIYNDTIDGLLNDIYKNIKATIPESDFTNLKMSERKWLKDIESYKIVMNSEDLGSMGGMTKAYAIANMRKFRILLLLLYYN